LVNIVEYLRERVVSELFNLTSVNNSWSTWKQHINGVLPNRNAMNILNLGDKLGDIFKSTSVAGRSQSSVSGGGAAWEGLVCWYLNLCLIGTNTVVIKQKKTLIPKPISDGLTVQYFNFNSNTESDLIAITFPHDPDYNKDIFSISVRNNNGQKVLTKKRNGDFNYLDVINVLAARDFDKYEVSVIQCKTNWNDNAQIPMLWDMVYDSTGFSRNGIQLGTNGFSINDLAEFSYAFVVVPTVNLNSFNSNSTAIQRVRNISGGNYWGYPSRNLVAHSLKEIFNKNFSNALPQSSLRANLNNELQYISSTYQYFNL